MAWTSNPRQWIRRCAGLRKVHIPGMGPCYPPIRQRSQLDPHPPERWVLEHVRQANPAWCGHAQVGSAPPAEQVGPPPPAEQVALEWSGIAPGLLVRDMIDN